MNRGPKEKKERALGERLGLKGARCASPKCAAVRRPYKPGVHGKAFGNRPRNQSDFGRQLMEKQKFKVSYGINERGLHRLFDTAKAFPGGTSMKLLELLERRLDNVIYRLGFAPSRSAARQYVVQGHVLVSGKRVRSPGLSVEKDDIISLRKTSLEGNIFRDLKESLKDKEVPAWLSLDPEKVEGKVLVLPTGEKAPFEISLLVESFSK